MNLDILNNPLFTVTLPLLGGMWLASHAQNKRIDDIRTDIREELGRIWTELREIRKELASQGERIAKLEERIPPLVHR